MEHARVSEESGTSTQEESIASRPASITNGTVATVVSQSNSSGCNMCQAEESGNGTAAGPPSFIYAIGRVEARLPSLAVEKEFMQIIGNEQSTGLTDQQAFHRVLSDRANRYLARQLCWALTIEGIETYILQPRLPEDLDLLIQAIRPQPSPLDVDVVIGFRGPLAPPEMCNGLIVPIVIFDQIYSFDRQGLINSIPKPEKMDAQKFQATASEVFERIMQTADNAGATDEHRALNYLAVRYPKIYESAADSHGRNYSLTSVEVRASRLSGIRKIMDVIFTYTNRETDVPEKYFVRVDVTEEFPFLVTKLQPFYDRV